MDNENIPENVETDEVEELEQNTEEEAPVELPIHVMPQDEVVARLLLEVMKLRKRDLSTFEEEKEILKDATEPELNATLQGWHEELDLDEAQEDPDKVTRSQKLRM